jgi:hypothetical protein
VPAPRYRLLISIPSDDLMRLSFAMSWIRFEMDRVGMRMPIAMWIEHPDQDDEEAPPGNGVPP